MIAIISSMRLGWVGSRTRTKYYHLYRKSTMETVEKPNLKKLWRSLALYAGLAATLLSCKSSEQYDGSRNEDWRWWIEITIPQKESNKKTHDTVSAYTTKEEIADTMQRDSSNSYNISNITIEDSATDILVEQKSSEEKYSDIKVQKIQQTIAQNHEASTKYLIDPNTPSWVIEAIAKTLAEHHPKYFEGEKEEIKKAFLKKKKEEVKWIFGDLTDEVMEWRDSWFESTTNNKKIASN